jgi:flagellar hook protein FlgE
MKAYRQEGGDLYYINDNAVDSVNMQPLNLNTIGGTARATSNLSIGANLPANAEIGTNEKTNALIFDSLGNSHNLLYEWTKRAQNTWDVQATPPEGANRISIMAQDNASVYYSAGRLDFTAIPRSGESITIRGQDYDFVGPAGAEATGIDTDGDTVADVTFTTLSDMMNELATLVNADFEGVAGTILATTGKTWPDNWVERIPGESAILMRNFGNAAIAVTTETANPVTDADGNPAILQTDDYTITALTPAGGGWAGSWREPLPAETSAVTFDGSGKPETFFGYSKTDYEDPRPTATIDWSNGAEASEISQFFGNFGAADGLQQLAGEYQLNYVTQNGNRFGNYSGVTVSETGIVTALFDNGVQAPIFMIPVATFVNPNGMNPLTGNVFQQTDNSGLPTVREAGAAGAGTVAQATLESSTVDLGEEFTNMITTQRAYSAAAKIITTSDDMLEELIRIKQ